MMIGLEEDKSPKHGRKTWRGVTVWRRNSAWARIGF